MAAKTKAKPAKFRSCTLKQLPDDLQAAAVENAIAMNPQNAPPFGVAAALSAVALVGPPTPGMLTALVARLWPNGQRLTVSFMDGGSAALRSKILTHLNLWSEHGNVSFAETAGVSDIRIARGAGGYYSYLGTDCRMVPKAQPTLNLEGFTERTSDSEFLRVVVHEAGHALGFPHEHQRRQMIDRLDAEKVVSYFGRTQGWSRQQVIEQVLTPLEERSILSSDLVDEASIMTYSFPGTLTKSGTPIQGGSRLTAADKAHAAKVYPKPEAPPPPVAAGDPVLTRLWDAQGRLFGEFQMVRKRP